MRLRSDVSAASRDVWIVLMFAARDCFMAVVSIGVLLVHAVCALEYSAKPHQWLAPFRNAHILRHAGGRQGP